MKKTCKIIETRSAVPLTLAKGPKSPGVLSRTIHTDCQVVKPLPIFRYSIGLVRLSEMATKSELSQKKTDRISPFQLLLGSFSQLKVVLTLK